MTQLAYSLRCHWHKLLKATLFTTILLFAHFAAASAQASGCTADAGTLDALDVCLLTDQIILKATHRGDTTIPQGFQVTYVLTRSSGLIIEQLSNEPVFTLPGTSQGLYTIHTLVYDPATLNLNTITLGQTTGFEVNTLLVQGGGSICAALDVKGAKARFGTCEDTCFATAGTLKANSGNCLQNGSATLTASIQTAAIVPQGFTRLYVLTAGDDLVIQQVSTTASFQVTSAGKFTIHTLVYDSTTLDLDLVTLGETKASEVNALLIQGGGTICGALDVTGATFNVTACAPVCTVRAGSLQADKDSCLVLGKAILIAKKTLNPIVPQGYQVRYLLSSGYGLVIQQINTTPSFTVTNAGLYTIHTLVYDPNTFNLNTIQLGWTKASEVNSLLVFGGGSICGAIDLIGATFNVKECPPPPCYAKVGKLKADGTPCLQNGTAHLKTKFLTYPVVPQGYKVVYLLSSGNNLRLEQIANSPSFIVNRTGLFTIHFLVYNPNTLDLDEFHEGFNTVYEIEEKIYSSGGYICAALDIKGLEFFVEQCVACSAKAGKLQPANDPCLEHYDATLKAQIVQNPVVPNGYAVRYLLSYGNYKVIQKISTTPEFDVTSEGIYSIHMFVYNPNTFNLNNIYLGVTSIQDLHQWLIQGGGHICAALDLYGAQFDLENCGNSCNVDAGSLFAVVNKHCLNPTARLVAFHYRQPTTANGYKIAYLLAYGNGGVIKQINESPSFQVNESGNYRIYTLVYNPFTLNLNSIQLGVTKFSTVNGWLVQSGGSICGALDVQGVAYEVTYNCNNAQATDRINAYPNPVKDFVNVEFAKTEKVNNIRVELLDITGNVIKTWSFDGETQFTSLDVSDLITGMYNVRVIYDDQLMQNLRVAKAQY